MANLNRVRETKRLARTTSPVKPGPPAHAAPAAAALVTRPRPGPAPADNDRPAARRPAGAQRRPVSDGPITASTVLAWAETWVQMSADEELMSGPLTDDELARRYGSSARTLRRLRKAVLSGALRQQAERLGVTLPHGFVDVPQIQTVEASPGSPGD